MQFCQSAFQRGPALQVFGNGTVDFRGYGAKAINMDTGAIVERILEGAKPIDIYVVKQNLERTVKISIAKQLASTEFLTHLR